MQWYANQNILTVKMHKANQKQQFTSSTLPKVGYQAKAKNVWFIFKYFIIAVLIIAI